LCKQKKILEAIFAIFGEPDHEHSKNQFQYASFMHGKQDLKINTLLQYCHARVLDTYAMENKEWIVVTEAVEFMLLCWIITWNLILYFFDPLFNATCSSMR
jgi:hypothetical protein